MIIEVLGYLGSALILLAYAAVTLGWRWNVSAVSALNCFASCLLLVNNVAHGAWPGAALSAAWAIIAIVALVGDYAP